MSVKKRGELSNGLPPDDESEGGDHELRPKLDLDLATELELLDAAFLGDMQAFSKIFEHYRPDLYTLCNQRLDDPSLAEDVVQEVFLRGLSRLPTFDRSKRVWPWLATIAFRMCTDLQRRRSFTHYSADIEVSVDNGVKNGAFQSHTGSALDEVIASEERVELWKSLDVLPERQRRVFLSYTLDEMSCPDIAAAEGISVGLVHVLLFRARKKMRSVHQGSQTGPLPAIVFPFSWLRWKLQQLEERVRPFLGIHGDGFLSACVQAACLGTVAMMVVAAGHPTEPFADGSPIRSEEIVLSAQSQSLQTAPLRTALPNIGVPAKAPVESQQSVAEAAGFLPDDVINPNQNATPETTSFSSIIASPNYESDHTILAAGSYASHYVLFASHDGGGTWKPRPSRLLDGSVVVLPPTFPYDERVFMFGGNLGLYQSDDGGEVFRVVSPIPGQGVAISPTFGRGDSKILMGGRTIFEYDAGTGATQPALLAIPPAPGGNTYPSIAFSPGYRSDSTVFVSDPDTLYRCRGSFCDKTKFPNPGPLRFRFSPSFEQDGLAYAFTPYKLLVSHDGGQHFGEVQFPLRVQFPLVGGYIRDLAIAWNGTVSNPAIFASVYENSSRYRYPPGIYRSLDGGNTWSKISIDLPGFGSGAKKLIITPTGRLLATGVSSGIACSEDKGQTWAPRCPPEK